MAFVRIGNGKKSSSSKSTSKSTSNKKPNSGSAVYKKLRAGVSRGKKG